MTKEIKSDQTVATNIYIDGYIYINVYNTKKIIISILDLHSISGNGPRPSE